MKTSTKLGLLVVAATAVIPGTQPVAFVIGMGMIIVGARQRAH